MNNRACMIAVIVCLAFGTVAHSAVLSVQGHLANGGASLDGAHPAVFSLHSSSTGGSALWTEADTIVVVGSLFNLYIGRNTSLPDSLLLGSEMWWEVTVDGQVLSPRVSYHAPPQTPGSSSLWVTSGANATLTSGNVGIGTATPQASLQIERTASGEASTILLRSNRPGTGPYGLLQFQNTLASEGGIAAEIAAVRPIALWGQESDLLFSTNPGSPSPALVERLRITKDGYVGIGTSTPRERLEIYDGRLLLTGSDPHDTAKLYFINTAAGGNRGWAWQALDNGQFELEEFGVANNRVTISPGGNVGIGAPSPGQRLYVAGDLTVTGTKCRAVHDPEHGTLYFNAVESAEALFTTSGRAQLVDGRCHIELSPKWLAGVTVTSEHPLDVSNVTFYGPHGDWYVVPGTTGFDIVEKTGASVRVFWSAQARQRGYEDLYLNNPATALQP